MQVISERRKGNSSCERYKNYSMVNTKVTNRISSH